MEETSKKKFPRSFYSIALLFSSLITLAAIELLLAVFYPIPFSSERNMYYEKDPFTGYRVRANSIGYFQNKKIPAIANSRGHRDTEIPIEKGHDVFRIVVLGDSFTFGANVQREEAYPQVLEDLLNKQFNKTIEVVNTGVGGWSPFQYAQYYLNYGKKFDPDLIIVGFYVGNDSYSKVENVTQSATAVLGRRISKEESESKFITLKVFLYEKLNIVRLILNRRKGIKTEGSVNVERDDCQDYSGWYIYKQGLNLKRHLQKSERLFHRAKNNVYQIYRIKSAAEKDLIPVIVVLIPTEVQISPSLRKILLADKNIHNYDFSMPQTMLIEMFKNANIKTIDLLTDFKKNTNCLYMNDSHWTTEGHRLAATVISQVISPFLKKDYD
jgi:hypothetical protein